MHKLTASLTLLQSFIRDNPIILSLLVIKCVHGTIYICTNHSLVSAGVHQDVEYLKLYASRYGREEGLALLERTGMYLGPERYTLEHNPIDIMRGEVFRTCHS